MKVHSQPEITPRPYLGTSHAIETTLKSWTDYDYYGQVYLAVMDIPLCLVADTLLLPYALFRRQR
ncbi:MAG: YceK/YidQ family lipoprotein [Gammaproteobacteria bacterium]|nr:YceK/YidQ family lipoprotein [Gammaproteobacteria bacterium]